MAKETISPRQAQEIIRRVQLVTEKAEKKIEQKTQIFAENISKIWEDENAVKFMKTFENNMNDAVQKLMDNSNVLIDAVTTIANHYMKVGGMDERVSNPVKRPSKHLDFLKTVKSTFSDSENEDEFGFKNQKNGSAQVEETFDSLKNEMEKLASETITSLNRINAFGNVEVKNNISQSAGKVIDILNESMGTLYPQLKERIDQTEAMYQNVGQNAISEISTSNHLENVVEGIQMKYAPPIPVDEISNQVQMKYAPPIPADEISNHVQMKYAPPIPIDDISNQVQMKYAPPIPIDDISNQVQMKYAPPIPIDDISNQVQMKYAPPIPIDDISNQVQMKYAPPIPADEISNQVQMKYAPPIPADEISNQVQMKYAPPIENDLTTIRK